MCSHFISKSLCVLLGSLGIWSLNKLYVNVNVSNIRLTCLPDGEIQLIRHGDTQQS